MGDDEFWGKGEHEDPEPVFPLTGIADFCSCVTIRYTENVSILYQLGSQAQTQSGKWAPAVSVQTPQHCQESSEPKPVSRLRASAKTSFEY